MKKTQGFLVDLRNPCCIISFTFSLSFEFLEAQPSTFADRTNGFDDAFHSVFCFRVIAILLKNPEIPSGFPYRESPRLKLFLEEWFR